MVFSLGNFQGWDFKILFYDYSRAGPGEGNGNPTPVLLPGECQTEEPGRLQSMGSQRVGHDWSDLAHTHMVFKETWNPELIQFSLFSWLPVLHDLPHFPISLQIGYFCSPDCMARKHDFPNCSWVHMSLLLSLFLFHFQISWEKVFIGPGRWQTHSW